MSASHARLSPLDRPGLRAAGQRRRPLGCPLRKSLLNKPHNMNRINEMRNVFQYGTRRVAVIGVQGRKWRSLLESILGFKNPDGVARAASLDYAPMSLS